LSNEVPESLMTSILESVAEPARAAEELVNTANERGGSDNITAVVLDVVGTDPLVATPEEETAAGSPDDPGGRSSMTIALGGGTGATGVSGQTAVGTLERTDVRPGETAGQGSKRERKAREKASDGGSRARGLTERPAPIITGRFLIFVVLVFAVLAGGWGIVRLYMDSNYFLAVDKGQIVVEQGRPGGFLWFDPKVIARTGVKTSQIPSYQVSGLSNGSFTGSSAAAAQAQVRRMVLQECNYEQGVPGATTTTSPPGLPAIARCPSNPTPQVTPPPSTSSTTSTSTTSANSASSTTSTTIAAAGGTG
jgi:protein phosphatase